MRSEREERERALCTFRSRVCVYGVVNDGCCLKMVFSESKLYRLPLSMQTRISLTAQHLHTTRTPPPHFKIARSRTLSLSHIPHIHTALLNTRPHTSHHISHFSPLSHHALLQRLIHPLMKVEHRVLVLWRKAASLPLIRIKR